MVLAFSRFKVANGLEDAVLEAFLNRPGLVDGASGFLGLEVFTDTDDGSLFYLITRWTDAQSFRQWHAGPDHTESHKGIPKGLKLDPAFTLIRTLDRISAAGASMDADRVRDFAPVISEFLSRSDNVHWLKVRSDGVITGSNHAMRRTMSTALDSLEGAVFWPLLTEPDAVGLRRSVESGTRPKAIF